MGRSSSIALYSLRDLVTSAKYLRSISRCRAAYGPRGFVRARYEIYVSARGVDIAGSPFVVFAADGSSGAVPQPPVLFALPRCRGGPAHLLRTRTSAHTNAQSLVIAAVGWYATVVHGSCTPHGTLPC